MEDTERIIQQDKLEHEDLEKSRTPRRVIHFSSGEMMEEFSTDEEEAETNTFQTVDTLLNNIKEMKITQKVRQSTSIPKRLVRSVKKKGGFLRSGTV